MGNLPQEKLMEGELTAVLQYLLQIACKVEFIWMFDVLSERGETLREIKDQKPSVLKLFPCNMNLNHGSKYVCVCVSSLI